MPEALPREGEADVASRRPRKILQFGRRLAFVIVLLAIGLETFLVLQLLDTTGLRGPESKQILSFACGCTALLAVLYRAEMVISRRIEAHLAASGSKVLVGDELEGALACWGEVRIAEAAGSDCVVCLDPICAGDTVRGLRRCGHMFHRDCIDPWLAMQPVGRHSCPLCRQQLDGLPDAAVRAEESV